MKKISAVIIFIVFIFSSNPSFAEETQKYRVAVSDLVISENIPAKQADLLKHSSLISDIENAIRNGRKFELLTRRVSSMEAIRKEQEFAQSDLAAGNAAQEGQMANAQALIQVTVVQFNFGRTARKVPNTEKYRVSDHCSIEVSVQIIDTERGSIQASFPIKASSSTGSSIANSVGGASPHLLDSTLEKAAGSLANQLADTIFPIQVLAVKDNKLWVNRGNDSGLHVGDIFEVFEPGEELIDPQTGESLGSTELEVGFARVIRINPKVTILEMTKGDPSQIQAGFILRAPVKKK